MPNAGYLYVLINSALPGLIKIGKSGDPAERARQLSSTTSVPAPFVLVYQKDFVDCDFAETWVHELLESKGYRLSKNREFFTISSTNAIDAIIAAKSRESDSPFSVGDAGSTRTYGRNDLQMTRGEEPWADLLHRADDARYGFRGEIRDSNTALRLYEKAATLGAPEAFIALAEMQSDLPGKLGQTKALEWLMEGTKRGVRWCWAHLADTYLADSMKSDHATENARKCYRRFFDRVNASVLDDDQEREFFFRLKQYLSLIEISQPPENQDVQAIKHGVGELITRISRLSDVAESRARRNAVDDLNERADRIPVSAVSW